MKNKVNKTTTNSNWTRTAKKNVYNTPYGTYRVKMTINGTYYQKGGFTSIKSAVTFRDSILNKIK